MASDGWTTVRIRTIRKAAIVPLAKAAGVSVSEWIDRALAAALSGGAEEVGAPRAAASPRVGAASPRASKPARLETARRAVSSAEAKVGVRPIPRKDAKR